jgi:hypothetical protein
VIPDIYNVYTVPHILASIFKRTYLRCYWRYIENSMCVILQAWCQIKRTFSRLRRVNSVPGHIQCNYISKYWGFNIQQNVAPLLLDICWQFSENYTANMVPIQRTTSSLRNVYSCPGHIQCNYSSEYSGFNIQLNLPEVLFDICRHLYALYNANLVQYTAHNFQFTQCELWSRTYTV